MKCLLELEEHCAENRYGFMKRMLEIYSCAIRDSVCLLLWVRKLQD